MKKFQHKKKRYLDPSIFFAIDRKIQRKFAGIKGINPLFSTAHHLKFTSFEKNMHKYNNIHIFTHKFVQRSILVLTYKHTKYAQYKTVVSIQI